MVDEIFHHQPRSCPLLRIENTGQHMSYVGKRNTYPECNELTHLWQDISHDAIIGSVESHCSDQESKYQNVRQRCSHIDNLWTDDNNNISVSVTTVEVCK